MGRVKFLKAKTFFAKEYKDGTIVAFKNIGDNSPSYADQIHQIVLKSFGVDLFVSDIIESINGTDTHKGCIKESLFIYVKNGISISARGISLCPNKDWIEVKLNTEKVLVIKNNHPNTYFRLCILLLICIWGYNIIDNKNNTDEHNLPDNPIEENKTDSNVCENILKADNKEDVITPKQDNTNIAIVEDKNHIEKKDEVIISIDTTQNVKYKLNSNSSFVKMSKKEILEDKEKECKRETLKAEANNYIQIANLAYNDYADNFNESKGFVALTNYQKALDLNKKHDLFSLSERKRIEQKVNILEKELK